MKQYFKSPRKRIVLGVALSLLLIGTAVLLINTFIILPRYCPDSWFCQDIGNPQSAGYQTISGGTWTINASGSGIGETTSDQFRLISRHVNGDAQITAQITGQSTSTSQAGLMLRQTSDPGSPYFAILAISQDKLMVEYRTAFNGTTTVASTTAAHGFPLYLEIQRVGDVFQAGTSTDGTHYTLVPGSTIEMVMPASVLAGLAVSVGATGALGSATFANVTIGPPGKALAPPPPATPCPSGWGCADVGNPALPGSQSLSKNTWIVQGAGWDIQNIWDQFHYVWQTLTADGTLSVRVRVQTPTDPWAKAGLMIRQSTDPAAAYYAILVTPGNGITVQERLSEGYQAIQLTNIKGAAPAYLQITRSGNTYTAYTSGDGITWTAIPDSTLTIDMPGPVLAGLAVTSHNIAALSAVTFDAFHLSTLAPLAPSSCPAPWTCQDIGAVPLAGSQQFNAPNPLSQDWTVLGAGDIGNTSDAFRYIWQPLTGDGTIVTDVLTQDDPDPWAKAGLMLRESTDANAPYYAVFMTPGHGIVVQYRSAAGANSVMQINIAGGTPAYLQIGRAGDVFTAYTSTNEITWVPLAGSTVTLNLPGVLLAGLAVASHNPQALNTATFDRLQIYPQAQAQANTNPPARGGGLLVENRSFTAEDKRKHA